VQSERIKTAVDVTDGFLTRSKMSPVHIDYPPADSTVTNKTQLEGALKAIEKRDGSSS
jgi:hypothetical protein